MQNKTKIIQNIALARESRAISKKEFSDSGLACLSISLNIPGYPKHSDLWDQFFKQIVIEVKDYLLANRIILNVEAEQKTSDDAGSFYLASLLNRELDVFELKRICEKFEMEHPVGRVIDIDISDKFNIPVSSNKMKACVFCKSKPAIVCMREQSHSQEEIKGYINHEIENYLENVRKKEVCRKLSTIALQSILYEVSLTPKPGLVDKSDSGIHRDMNYYTFLNSSAVISSYFNELAMKGWSFNQPLSKALPVIRNIGIEMERQMFKATNNVNTQKGLIFLLGISLFASANILSKDKNPSFEDFRKAIKTICASLKDEQKQAKKLTYATHGEECFSKYGYELGGGIRKEAYEGFPTVFQFGLPQLDCFGLSINNIDLNNALTCSLLSIMSKNNDTNILYRSNQQTLEELKKKSQIALRAILKNNDYTEYENLIDFCKDYEISPGGSADLLAITVFFKLLQKEFNNYDQ